jgi:iron complex outermembrane receptor protein
MERVVVGADGKFQLAGKEWSYDAYAEYGQNEIDIIVHDMTLNRRYDAAIEAVRAPTAPSSAANPVAVASGCVPLNIIGNVPIDPAAMGLHRTGQRSAAAHEADAAGGQLQHHGEPFESWAGPVAIATGAEYRKRALLRDRRPLRQRRVRHSPNTAAYPADPLLSQPVGNNWYAGNYHNGKGTYDVKEAYLEAERSDAQVRQPSAKPT